MSGWDTSEIRSAPLRLTVSDPSFDGDVPTLTHVDAQNQFRQFLREHRSEDGATFPYREELRANYSEGFYFVKHKAHALKQVQVDLDHLHAFNESLHSLVTEHPDTYVPILESAAREVAIQLTATGTASEVIDDKIQVQVQLKNFPRLTQIRNLAADHVGKLVTIRGIVVSASRPRIKATNLTIMCRNCKATKQIACSAGFGGARFPRQCDTNINAGAGSDGLNIQKCPLDPYQILADNSEYVDQQRLKLQENPEAVPTGELPRHLSLSLDRYLVGAVKPGTRIVVVGMYTTYEAVARGGGAQGDRSDQRAQGASDAGIRIPYLRVLGIEQESEATDVLLGRYNAADEEQLRTLSRTPDLYSKITGSMCPAIFDNEDTRNIKQAIAVQLFGGSRKLLPDGMRLRGDINVLLLGDPSVAKSQFLKFASQVAPIGVYTSGKGASAAGLTATVMRDASSGEFHLEGGALVLADGGLVCIDEFDKMREQDRVAIHEAMEQQTISIAKAGITTILNSRTSVLAAANPVFGRYDDLRSPTDNIDFQTTILSRFDLIFIIRDIQDVARDRSIVTHIFNMHNQRDEAVKLIQDESGMVDIRLLKKYIAYARKTCHPRLNADAAELLKNQYVKFRGSVLRNAGSAAASSIPITVRQLEAVVRISEARARMELTSEATTEHVLEALRLFQVSTFRAATTGAGEGGLGSAKFDEAVKKAEAEITGRLGIGQQVSTALLVNYLQDRQIEKNVATRALDFLVQRGQLKFKGMRKHIERII